MVHGNCQAEALRVVLEASDPSLDAVRVPPVHELEADDLPYLDRLLARTDLLVAQPVRDDWRDLPVGTAQVHARAPRARLVVVPVIRHTGLHPWGALVRTPWMGDPPTVPYHDLRTILAVARGTGRRPVGHLRPAGFRAVAGRSLDELRRREERHGAVPASDLVEAAGAGAMLTINHPGNPVLVPLAGRVLEACGLSAVARDPGRTLLASVRAPIRPEVLDALGLDPAAADAAWGARQAPPPDGHRAGGDTWDVGGTRIDDDAVAREQAAWYAERGPVVAAALERYAPAIEALGL